MDSDKFQCYLVGGAVRDRLLGVDAGDRDWVVVGASPADMIKLGFCSVGKDFPVFLHPESGEEYALARTERKSGSGYHGFEFNTRGDVTLEDDLRRRDLTINAMAQDPNGDLIDPFGGRADLDNRILRHVSPAFAEDPVRILRVARFHARYAHMGFVIAPETLALMASLVKRRETETLTPERVWTELRRALDEPSPDKFIRALKQCGALKDILPEVDALFGIPQTKKYHPEVDTGEHICLCLQISARENHDNVVRFAVLVHDLGKALTPGDELPRHRGHEHAGIDPLKALCARLGVPKRYQRLALAVTRHHLKMHQLNILKPQTTLDMLESLNAFHHPDSVTRFSQACEADARGRAGLENQPYPQAALLRCYFEAAREIDAGQIDADLEGPAVGEAIRGLRMKAIARVKQQTSQPFC